MDSRKEPKVAERGAVIVDAALRKHVRKKLWADVVDARIALTPQRFWQLVVARNKTKAKNVVAKAGTLAGDNAPLIAVAALGILIFAARRPISKWLSRLWGVKKTEQTKIDRNEHD